MRLTVISVRDTDEKHHLIFFSFIHLKNFLFYFIVFSPRWPVGYSCL